MLENYLIIHKSILPDYFEKVLQVRRLMESGKVREVSQAVKQVGISRSTYYKYKDKILEPSQVTIGRKAVLSLQLSHEAGVLSKVLTCLSACKANILTITQSLPIRDQASVLISLDISGIEKPIDTMLSALETSDGVEKVRLVAVE